MPEPYCGWKRKFFVSGPECRVSPNQTKNREGVLLPRKNQGIDEEEETVGQKEIHKTPRHKLSKNSFLALLV